MKEQLKRSNVAEEEELLSVLSDLMSEIPPDIILRVFVDWDGRLWRCLLIEGEYVEYSFTLTWFLTGFDKRTRRVRVLNARPVTDVLCAAAFTDTDPVFCFVRLFVSA
jgi:hypothetical protein